MKIPYAALRFSNAKTNLGLNFMREIKRDVQKYTWNRVNTKIGAVITQAGTLEGIENIKPQYVFSLFLCIRLLPAR
jgi:hypothetical protein